MTQSRYKKVPGTLLQLEMLSVLFMVVPLFIFVSHWITTIYAAALMVGLLYLFLKHLSDPIQSKGIEIEWKYFLILFALAFVWVYFSGIGGFTYQNGDWKKHFALFHDLVNLDWPVVHQDPMSHTGQSFLVYYFGYYLVPALIGKFNQLGFYDRFSDALHGIWNSSRFLLASCFNWSQKYFIGLSIYMDERPRHRGLAFNERLLARFSATP